jgi:hypothetical protein
MSPRTSTALPTIEPIVPVLGSPPGWLHYVAFDLLWLNGRDLRTQQLSRRKRRLEGLIPVNNATLSRVLVVEEHGRELFDAAQRLDLEGIVAKRKRDPYSRQTIWYKTRTRRTLKPKGEETCSISHADPSGRCLDRPCTGR